MRVSYQPHSHGPAEVGFVEPIVDSHGQALVGAYLTTPDNPRALRVFKAGEAFDVDERIDQHLAAFCRQSPDFLLLNPGTASNLTRAGENLGG
jgi:hypothetical protein